MSGIHISYKYRPRFFLNTLYNVIKFVYIIEENISHTLRKNKAYLLILFIILLYLFLR